jgi:hypothetical protein
MSVISAQRVWSSHVEYDFDTYECDYDMHEYYFNTLRVILKLTN